MNGHRPPYYGPGPGHQGVWDARALHMPEPVYDADEPFEIVQHEDPTQWQGVESPMQPPQHPRFVEGQREQPEWNTLRWGDASTVRGVAAVGVAVAQSSQQLVRASVPRPTVWIVQFNLDVGAQFPAGEEAAVALVFYVTIGCGQSRTTVPYVMRIAAPYQPLPVVLNTSLPLSLPATDLQVIGQVQYLPTVAGAFSVPLAAMAAPWTFAPISLGEGPHANSRR